jgi:hypothetical protein
MLSTKKRRYVGNVNSKKRVEIEGSNAKNRRRLLHDLSLPSPEKSPPKLGVQSDWHISQQECKPIATDEKSAQVELVSHKSIN